MSGFYGSIASGTLPTSDLSAHSVAITGGTDPYLDLGTSAVGVGPSNTIRIRNSAGTLQQSINGAAYSVLGSQNWAQVLANGATTSGQNPQITTGDLLRFGGATSSFTALKPSGTTLALRLANDSGDASLTANNITVGASSSLGWSGRGTITTVSDGWFVLQTNGGLDFNLLGFGGSSSSFPALKRSGATLVVRRADDLADTDMRALGVTLAGGTVTANTPPLSVTQEWSNGAVAFEGIKTNVINAASAAGSRLFALQVSGTNKFSVNVNGSLYSNGVFVPNSGSAFQFYENTGTSGGTVFSGGVVASADGFASTALTSGFTTGDTAGNGGYGFLDTTNTLDARIKRTAAGVIKLDNGAGSPTNYVQLGSGVGVRTQAANMFGWAASTDATAAFDTNVSRDAAGVVAFGTSAANSSGSWRALNGTLGGTGLLSWGTGGTPSPSAPQIKGPTDAAMYMVGATNGFGVGTQVSVIGGPGSGTDKAAGGLVLDSGNSTGTGTGTIQFATPTPAGMSGAGANASTARLTLTSSTLTFANAVNLAFDTSTGTKIGTATTQKIGFFNATPVVQPTGVSDASGGTIIDVEARAAINAVISRLESLGLLATV